MTAGTRTHEVKSDCHEMERGGGHAVLTLVEAQLVSSGRRVSSFKRCGVSKVDHAPVDGHSPKSLQAVQLDSQI